MDLKTIVKFLLNCIRNVTLFKPDLRVKFKKEFLYIALVSGRLLLLFKKNVRLDVICYMNLWGGAVPELDSYPVHRPIP